MPTSCIPIDSRQLRKWSRIEVFWYFLCINKQCKVDQLGSINMAVWREMVHIASHILVACAGAGYYGRLLW